MRLSILLSLTLSLGLTHATPHPLFTPKSCLSGNPGSVYLCSNANFSGDCIYRPQSDDCFAPSSAPMSIRPNRGGYCVLFEDRQEKGGIIR